MTASTAETLRANLSALSASDRTFATSLLDQLARRGTLSDKQSYWLQKLAGRAASPAPAPVAVASSAEMQGVVALFDRAAKHLKYPAIVLSVAGVGAIRLNVAGERSRTPGVINVAENAPYGGRRWFGRISRAGAFEPGRDDATPPALVDTLHRFACDPAGVAAEHGRLTGCCCFCNTPLTDERSTAVGYGPVCARNYGLPWGKAASATATEQSPAVADQAAA